MGLFDRRKSENQVNMLPSHIVEWGGLFGAATRRKYSDMYLWLVLQTIFDGLKNVKFFADAENDVFEDAARFIDVNSQLIIWQYWNLGYICIGRRVDGSFYVPMLSEIHKDTDGRIINYDIVLYSEKYMFERKSDIDMIRPSLDAIDTYKNGEINLTEHYGALGILTGKGLPTNPAEKEDFEKDMKSAFGIQREKRQVLLTTLPLDFKQMTLPVGQLELAEKISTELKNLCRYFNVPSDMVFGGSTFDNQKQATINFYRGCIAPLAETLLKVGRYIIRKDASVLIPSEHLTFKIDNVAELEDDRTSEIEYKAKVVELIARMRELDLDTTEYEEQLKID